jgi:hypothetical protein
MEGRGAAGERGDLTFIEAAHGFVVDVLDARSSDFPAGDVIRAIRTQGLALRVTSRASDMP